MPGGRARRPFHIHETLSCGRRRSHEKAAAYFSSSKDCRPTIVMMLSSIASECAFHVIEGHNVLLDGQNEAFEHLLMRWMVSVLRQVCSREKIRPRKRVKAIYCPCCLPVSHVHHKPCIYYEPEDKSSPSAESSTTVRPCVKEPARVVKLRPKEMCLISGILSLSCSGNKHARGKNDGDPILCQQRRNSS